MKSFYNSIFTLLILLGCIPVSLAQSSQATYTVTYTSTWSESTHPHPGGNFPASAHYSKLVGATHNDNVVFLEMGGLASQGIEDVAELGNNDAFFAEVNTAINAGTANSLIDGDALATSTGTIEIEDIVTNEDYPLMTLVSMIAPSPDWMVAVNSVDLQDGNGDWRDSIEIDLYPYDAGTDSGIDYTSPNKNTDPQQPISSLQAIPPFSNEKMGTLTITLENVVLGAEDPTIDEFSIFPNPATDIMNIRSVVPIASVEVINVLGERIASFQMNASVFTLDLDELSSGIYMVKVNAADGSSAVKKLIKR